jgi:hypothetical protein
MSAGQASARDGLVVWCARSVEALERARAGGAEAVELGAERAYIAVQRLCSRWRWCGRALVDGRAAGQQAGN